MTTVQATELDGRNLTLGRWPTPVHRLWRLERSLATGPIFVKRDDLAGFAVAGNKTRPLEYLMGAAVADGCDVFVAGGRPDSNFCPAAAAAAAAAGLSCHLVIAVPDTDKRAIKYSANMRLAVAFGAELTLVHATGVEIDEQIQAHADRLSAAGQHPYAVPRGGSTVVGALGFADAAYELNAQLRALEERPAAVVCAVGSGGTYAGLLAGAAALGRPWPVIGVSVSRPTDEIAEKVFTMARRVGKLRNSTLVQRTDLNLVDALAPGHGQLSAAQEQLANSALRTEGLLLDPTYTAKAFQHAVERSRAIARGSIVFWHTGGAMGATARLVGGN